MNHSSVFRRLRGEGRKGSRSETWPEQTVGILAGDSLKDVLLSPGWLGGRQQSDWAHERSWRRQVALLCCCKRNKWKRCSVVSHGGQSCTFQLPPWGCACVIGGNPTLQPLPLFFCSFFSPDENYFWVQQSSYKRKGSPHYWHSPIQPFLFSWPYTQEWMWWLHSGGWSLLQCFFFSCFVLILFIFFNPGQFESVNYPEVKKTSFNVKATPACVKYLTLGMLRLALQSTVVSFRGK